MPNQDDLNKADYEALAAFRHTLRRFLHFSEEGARQVGLTPRQHQLLLAIKGQPGKDWASVAELAEALQLTHQGAVMLVDRCARGQWVQRSVDPDDRRQVRVLLTAAGDRALAQVSAANRRELRALRHALESAAFDTED